MSSLSRCRAANLSRLFLSIFLAFIYVSPLHAAAQAFDEIGWHRLAARDPLAAVEDLRTRLAKGMPKDDRIRANALLGELFSERLGDPVKGATYFRAAMAIDPSAKQVIDLRYALARALISAGDFPAARSELQFLLEQRPDHPFAFSIRATIKDLAGRRKLLRETLPKRSFMKKPKVSQARPPKAEAPSGPMIRVLVARSPVITVSSGGSLFLYDADAKRLGKVGGPLTCRREPPRIRCGDYTGDVIQVIPAKGRFLEVGEGRFRGGMIIRPEGENLLAVNRLVLEEYLYGVLPREVPFSWPREALRAQAVAARTYAYSQIERSEGMPYDVESTVLSQVYGGLGAEQPSTNDAVNATAGQILRYGGETIVAYFHAHSGGRTEDPVNVWGARLPYLKSRRDPYSLASGPMTWSASYSRDELQKKLGKDYSFLGSLRDLKVAAKNGSRVGKVSLVGANRSIDISSNRLRLLVGPATLKSTAFQLDRQGGKYVFRGYGYGHGVGMSQWGAMAMAKKGLTYRQILGFYYDGVVLARLPENRD